MLVSNVDVYVGDQVAYHITVKNTGDVGLDNIYFIEDDKLCVLYSSDKNTHVSFITTGNEHLQDIAFKNNYGALYACPVNEEYSQFILFDSFGRILLVDTEGE